jgi:hypothetical protein
MSDSTLTRERLARIQSLLRRSPEGISVRDLARSYGVRACEVEQAVALGWLEIVTRKPRVGRPARLARLASDPCNAKLPPYRAELERPISIRHFLFAVKSLLCTKRGRRGFMPMPPMVDAYLQAFPRARKRRAAMASVSRLLRHPDVRAARAWFYAQVRQEIPRGVEMPSTANAIWQALSKRGA